LNFGLTDIRRITNSAIVKYSRNNYGAAWGWVRKGVLFDISFRLVLQLNYLGYEKFL